MGIKLGTRGSKLALWQAHHVGEKLVDANIPYEIQVIHTTGDGIQNIPLSSIGEVGLFTKALDQALLSDEVDIAVHSAKDMPSEMPEGLEILACLERADPRDVLLSVSKEVHPENLSRKWTIGTSSERRKAFISHYFEHFEVKDIRGNIDSRIEKMKSGHYDGIILAAAGVKRMGFEEYISHTFRLTPFTPAVGQGIIAVVCKEDLEGKAALRTALNHSSSEIALTCERAFLKEIQGGCSTPLFGHAQVMYSDLVLEAGIVLGEENYLFREKLEGHIHEAEKLGIEIGRNILHHYNS